jgi:hypothetical protein
VGMEGVAQALRTRHVGLGSKAVKKSAKCHPELEFHRPRIKPRARGTFLLVWRVLHCTVMAKTRCRRDVVIPSRRGGSSPTHTERSLEAPVGTPLRRGFFCAEEAGAPTREASALWHVRPGLLLMRPTVALFRDFAVIVVAPPRQRDSQMYGTDRSPAPSQWPKK